MVTGIDLVKLQIRVAAGEPLGIKSGMKPRGHAIECRINAEHPVTFTPSPGPLKTFHLPGGPGTRVDTHGYEDYVIPPHYDSLVAKLIVHGADRAEAIARAQRALREFVLVGPATTIPYHRAILASPDFRSGKLTTNFIAEHPELLDEMARFEEQVSPMDYSAADPRKIAAAVAAVAAMTHR
jgi:biotin carboxylase